MSENSDDQFQPPPELMAAWEEHAAIVKLGDPVLRQVARPVNRILHADTQKLIEHMKVVMRAARGLGLAAPQVGVSQRVIIYDVDDHIEVLVNPVIVNCRGEQLDPPEGCLSIPGLQGQVKRANEIRVRAQDQRGRPVSKRVSELEARVIQHEIDHLDGVLFIDKADPATLAWVIGSDDEDEPNAAPHE